MQDIDLTQSVYKQEQNDEKNEFLQQASFQYECCPYCERNFFIGKLKFHLKLCNINNPMSKSPLKKIKRNYLNNIKDNKNKDKQKQYETQIENKIDQKVQKQQSSNQCSSPLLQNNNKKNSKYSFQINANKFKKCQYCTATFPCSMIQRHSKKCNMKPIDQNFSLQQQKHQLNSQSQFQIKSHTKIDFNKLKPQQLNHDPLNKLPRIRNSAKQKKFFQKKYISTDLKQLGQYTVKIREQLSCFKKALQVQKISCPHCTRRFSTQASLRHIPICEKLKDHQKHSIILKKHSKSQVYKLNLPIKRNSIVINGLRANFMDSLENNDKEKGEIENNGLKYVKTDRVRNRNNLLIINKDGNEQNGKSQRGSRNAIGRNLLSIKKVERLGKIKYNGKQDKNLNVNLNVNSFRFKPIIKDVQQNIQGKKIETQSKSIEFSHSDPMNMTFSKNFIPEKEQVKIQEYQQKFENPQEQKFQQSSSNGINQFLSVKIN